MLSIPSSKVRGVHDHLHEYKKCVFLYRVGAWESLLPIFTPSGGVVYALVTLNTSLSLGGHSSSLATLRIRQPSSQETLDQYLPTNITLSSTLYPRYFA